jgi:hypothetical protein
MLKTAALLLAGLAAGFVIAWWLAPSADPPPTLGAGAAAPLPSVAPPDGDLKALAAALASESEQRAALEERVEALAAELEILRSGPVDVPPSRDSLADTRGAEPAPFADGPPFLRDPAAPREDVGRRQVERLIAAGFPPDRAEWINRRTQELRMESLQAQYDATREGRALEPGVGERKLRTELGDSDYERYLTALGRPTSVGVREVLASSPAERVGLKSGDEVVAYDGKRVFDARELNALTLEGTAGESVVVEIRRAGQPLQLVIPRGPLGILGGFRGRPR